MVLIAMLLSAAAQLFMLIIIVQVALSWLIAFEIVNAKNDAAVNLMALLKKATDPVYKPLKKYVPPVGGIDITPLVVIIGIQIVAGILIAIIT